MTHSSPISDEALDDLAAAILAQARKDWQAIVYSKPVEGDRADVSADDLRTFLGSGWFVLLCNALNLDYRVILNRLRPPDDDGLALSYEWILAHADHRARVL